MTDHPSNNGCAVVQAVC